MLLVTMWRAVQTDATGSTLNPKTSTIWIKVFGIFLCFRIGRFIGMEKPDLGPARYMLGSPHALRFTP